MLTGKTNVYNYDKQFEEVENDTALILHSSGTTGMPNHNPSLSQTDR